MPHCAIPRSLGRISAEVNGAALLLR